MRRYRAKTFLWRCVATFGFGFGMIAFGTVMAYQQVSQQWMRAMTAFSANDYEAGMAFLLSVAFFGFGCLVAIGMGAGFVWFGMTGSDADINCEKTEEERRALAGEVRSG